jgi:hypothetical protein
MVALPVTTGRSFLAGQGSAGLAPRPKAIFAALSAGKVNGWLDESTPSTTLAD